MATVYLERLCVSVNQTDTRLLEANKLECKHFFSGAALYVDNSICITLSPVGLALKLPVPTLNKLFNDKIARRLKYFSKKNLCAFS